VGMLSLHSAISFLSFAPKKKVKKTRRPDYTLSERQTALSA
jgi:hypothetical protein